MRFDSRSIRCSGWWYDGRVAPIWQEQLHPGLLSDGRGGGSGGSSRGKAAEEAASNTLAATITAAAITAAIASVTTAPPEAAPEAAPAVAPNEPHELAVVGTRVNIEDLFGVVWMVTEHHTAVAFDCGQWAAFEHSDFAQRVFKELTLDPDTAVVGVLHNVIGGDTYPSAFLYEAIKLMNPCWRFYSRFKCWITYPRAHMPWMNTH